MGGWVGGLVGVRGDVRKRFDFDIFSFTSSTFFIFLSLITFLSDDLFA